MSKPDLSHVVRYKCIGGIKKSCASTDGLSRGDVIGCQFFCGSDFNSDGHLSREEQEHFVLLCNGFDPGQYISTYILSWEIDSVGILRVGGLRKIVFFTPTTLCLFCLLIATDRKCKFYEFYENSGKSRFVYESKTGFKNSQKIVIFPFSLS